MSTNTGSAQKSRTLESQLLQDPPWWNRRTRLERTLCFVTVISLILLVVTIIVFAVCGFVYLKHTDDSAGNLCLTPGCIKFASEILLNIDEKVDPCTDFYQFACGRWIDRHTIPEDKPVFYVSTKLWDTFSKQLRVLLEKKLDDTDPPYVKMIKDFYNSCMDTDTIEKAGAEPLKKALKSLGGWPIVEGKEWNENKFDWLETLIALRNFGYDHNIFLTLQVTADRRNTTFHTIVLDTLSLGMPDSKYYSLELNGTVKATYYNLMIEAAKHLGSDESFAKNELLKVLDFEATLANYSELDKNERNVSKWYNKFTVKELQDAVPQIPWLKYLNGLLDDEIYENETLIVGAPDFMRSLADLISTTEKRVIANYMLWRVVKESLVYLSKEWKDIRLEYIKSLIGQSQSTPRWELCVLAVNENLNIALSAYYVRQHFDEDSKIQALVIAHYIHEKFLHILDEIEWMDEITKSKAKAKAANMEFLFGYPNELLNNTAVIELYKTLIITNESYYENIFKIEKWSKDFAFAQLRKPNVRGEWTKYAEVATINAFFNVLENIIYVPAGILQSPFFNKEYPNYVNFGAIGSLVGHEITHGFDDQGRQYDKDGNNVNWWEQATDEKFRQKAECIINQYSNYTTEFGVKLNGINTQGENIADNGGLKEAYWAYLSWADKNGPEQLLPGLNYNQRQLFWISFAQIYCGKDRPEVQRYLAMTDAHSPNKFRVVGTISNLKEFTNDFNCPSNSPMNRQHKCQVW